MLSNNILNGHYIKSDKMMLIINGILMLYALVLAPENNTWIEAIAIGGGTTLALLAIYNLAPGSVVSRVAIGIGFMVQSALHIHQAQGMIEMHFGIFVLLGALLYYRDWVPLLAAALAIAVHHFTFFYLQSTGANIWVFATTENGWWIVILHAGYVIAETAAFIWLSIDLRRDAMQAGEVMSLTDRIVLDDHIDLTLRSTGDTELLKRFDRFTNEVELLAKKVASTAVALKVDGEVLADVTAEMKSNTDIQRSETDLIAQAVEELSVAVEGVSKNAEIAATVADNVDQSASKATSMSEKTVLSIEQLAICVDQASAAIRGLHEKTKSIGSVLDVIRGIADQTNLLALNAAIEAARAGDQGRGFAVVADEVRTLAQRTQESTQEIDHMIDSLQSSSEATVQIIEKSMINAGECVVNTNESLELMRDVGRSIGEINQMNAMISRATSEQLQVTGEVSRNLANIVETSNKSASDSAKAAGSGAELLVISTNLELLTKKFKVSH